MGRPKALLPFGPELLLQRVVRLLQSSVAPIVVVAAAEGELPDLPAEVLIARDRQEYRGPLAGIAGGLAVLDGLVHAAFVTGCDAPFLGAAFIRRVIECLGDAEVAVPQVDGIYHPLAAAYRLSVLPQIEAMLARDRLRTANLFESVRTRELKSEELRDADPFLASLRNLNEPAEYLSALADAGFKAPPDVVAAVASGKAETQK
jgi:molybdopterin-guanine dinucleotide biosynthesis protein A